MPLGITDITQQINLLETIINTFPQAYFPQSYSKFGTLKKVWLIFSPVYIEQRKQ